ncbi:stage II sporulation protein M [Natranaerobius trueperi]|uniref:Stage II sporulation protein M n=1 Tax=Natranaerobius trueperi TaxID=759412 RepID=A0A226BYI4_9FIRM|nr:stage II sporulation protein M [Natranaerobius trueperi]OWZ83991.1 stage II sporulation protein M [Natranaerobius trueperi]
MLVSVKEILSLYIKYNLILFLIVILLFMVGAIIGGFVVSGLSDDITSNLQSYLDNFYHFVSEDQSLDYHQVFLSSLGYHITLLGIIWLLGITMIGIPVLLLLVFLRGVAFGFTMVFLLQQSSFQEVIMAMISILPHNLLFIPSFFIISVASISFSILLIKNQLRRKSIHLMPELINYTLLFVMIGVGFIAGSLIEAYISPTFMRIFLQYL